MRNIIKFAPFTILVIVGLFLAVGLFRTDQDSLPSPLVEKEIPVFELTDLYDDEKVFSHKTLQEPGVKVVNVWASWCGPCRLEHKHLMTLQDKGVKIYGFNYKDDAQKAKKFLDELGNPFVQVGFDRTGRTGIDWGVYGVPETFVINSKGIITYKHVGPIQNDDLSAIILPKIREAAITK